MRSPKGIAWHTARWAAIVSLVASSALTVASPVAAVCSSEKNWSGGNGDWTDGTHWTGGVPPLATQTACLPSGFYTVTVDATTTAVAGGLIVQTNAKLLVKGTSATTLTIGTNVATNAGTIEIGFGTDFHAQVTVSFGATLTNTGTIRALGFGNELDASLNNLGVFDAQGAVVMQKAGAVIANSGAMTASSQVDILNATSFTMTGGSLTNNFIFTIHGGTVTHDGGSVTGNPVTLHNVTINANSSDDAGLFELVQTGNILGSDVGSAETLIIEGGNVLQDGVLTSAENRTNNGTIRLAALDNTTTARLEFAAGKTLTISSIGTLQTILGNGPIDSPHRKIRANVVNQGKIDVFYNADFDLASTTFQQTFSGFTNLFATLDLTGSAGTLTLDGGSLTGFGTLKGNVNNTAGNVSPGSSAGLLTIDGAYQQGGGGSLVIELGGTSAGSESDRLVVTGVATLNGTLDLNRLDSFSPSNSFAYDFLQYASHTGTMTMAGTNAGGGRQWASSFNATAGHLTVNHGANTQRPDGQIKLGTGAFVGNNIYNNNGSGQQKSKATTPGNVVKFSIQISNDGTGNPDSFLVHATGNVVSGYTVKYKRGSKNITTAVVNGTFHTASLAPATSRTIKVIVTMTSGASHGSDLQRLVTISSFTDSTVVDAVGLNVHRN